jgi:glucosamine--fructose-6-phosphate aminotransferase (isomerizing)
MSLYDEILEQPEVLSNLVRSKDKILDIAQILRSKDIKYIFLTARGSSDNAGLYAKYLFGSVNKLPVALAAPSLFTIYKAPPRLEGALVMGISQSGMSTDLLEVIKQSREMGCTTIAITNAPDSPLSKEAEFVIDIQAGKERAVAATKTYTAQLFAIAMLSSAMADEHARFDSLEVLPNVISQIMEQDSQIANLAEGYRHMDRCIVLGRGYNYCTAYEWALKMEEMTYVVAEPYSSADFRHGPIAIIEKNFPVFVAVPDGVMVDEMVRLLNELRSTKEAKIVAISNRRKALDLATSPMPIPEDIPEWISPIPAIVPAQLFVYHLTRAKGLDTEHPRGLRKVTDTR